MRAAVLTAPGQIRIVLAPIPRPRANQVLIRVEGCGVCASNLGPWKGLAWSTYPSEPGDLGHEAWGTVAEVGDPDGALAVGDRVAALSFRGFAEYDVADVGTTMVLPSSLHGQAVPGEPLGCAMNIFRRSGIEPGQVVAIVGIGFLGAILTKLASEAGARVLSISRRSSSLDLARHFGAAETIAMDDHWRIVEAVKTLTEGRLCERVIEAVGHQWPLDLAGELVGEGGKLIVAGYHQDGPRQVNMQAWNWKGIDVINAHERDTAVCMRGMRDALDAVASGRLDPSALYSHTFPLERLGEALDATRDKPAGFVKALIAISPGPT